MDQPAGVTGDQFAEWKEKRLRPAQTRVLQTFKEWVERFFFVKDEPHLVERLKEFLLLIRDPAKNALSAKHLLETIGKRVSIITAPIPSGQLLTEY